jgi:hypothetical protein
MRTYVTTALFLGLLGFGKSGAAQEAPPTVYDPYNQPTAQYDPGIQQVQYDPNGEAYAQDAAPAHYGYVGIHPIPYEAGAGICLIQGAHFHEYPPFDQYLFRQAGGYFYFVGDVADFGYNGELWGYQANHPIPVEYGGGYCFINWPHRHHYAPPPGLAFNFVGGYYVYAGPWAPAYYRHRDAYWGYFGNYYRHNYYGGRYWTVRPRHIYRRSYAVGAPGVYRPGVTVRAPGGARVVVAPAPNRHGGYVPPPVHSRVHEAPPPVVHGPPPTVRRGPPPPAGPPPGHHGPPPPAGSHPARGHHR